MNTGELTEQSFDAAAETVTDAWEGAFIYMSWGYDQTNVTFAQIIDVSDSGRTVCARLVTAETVDRTKASDHLQPTAEQYGDEFRLHVRNCRATPPSGAATHISTETWTTARDWMHSSHSRTRRTPQFDRRHHITDTNPT